MENGTGPRKSLAIFRGTLAILRSIGSWKYCGDFFACNMEDLPRNFCREFTRDLVE